jgi:hypothetical protein
VSIRLDEKKVIDILSKREYFIKIISTQREELAADLYNKDGVIQQISLKGKEFDKLQLGKTNNRNDIGIVYERTEKELLNQIKVINKQLDELQEEENLINTVWIAYRNLDKEEYELIGRLYIKMEKWDVICKDLGITRSTLQRRRKQVMKHFFRLIDILEER